MLTGTPPSATISHPIFFTGFDNKWDYFYVFLLSLRQYPFNVKNNNKKNNCSFSLQVKPCECIMVGDNIVNDIKGGKNAGVKITVWLNARGKIAPSDIQPDYIIEDIKDLETVFRDLSLLSEG